MQDLGKVDEVDIDLEGDFDPEMHDQKMKNIFDEEYYGNQSDNEANSKPIFSDSETEAQDLNNGKNELEESKAVKKAAKSIEKIVKKVTAKSKLVPGSRCFQVI